METKLIAGIVISEFDEHAGPVPFYYFPPDLSPETLNDVSSITIDAYLNRKSTKEQLLFIPFPNVNRKGVVNIVEWDDPRRRGGKGLGSITLLFEEQNDPIFYKYIKDLEYPFSHITEAFINLRKQNQGKDQVSKIADEFQLSVYQILKTLANQEIQASNQEEFPVTKDKFHGAIDYSLKVIVVGDAMVGKSSMILQYTDKAFRRSYLPTIGINMTEKDIMFEGLKIQLIFWDLAGQAKYQRMRHQFYGGAIGAIIVYDITRRSTFENIWKWYADIKENIEPDIDMKFILCGNKIDLQNEKKSVI